MLNIAYWWNRNFRDHILRSYFSIINHSRTVILWRIIHTIIILVISVYHDHISYIRWNKWISKRPLLESRNSSFVRSHGNEMARNVQNMWSRSFEVHSYISHSFRARHRWERGPWKLVNMWTVFSTTVYVRPLNLLYELCWILRIGGVEICGNILLRAGVVRQRG